MAKPKAKDKRQTRSQTTRRYETSSEEEVIPDTWEERSDKECDQLPTAMETEQVNVTPECEKVSIEEEHKEANETQGNKNPPPKKDAKRRLPAQTEEPKARVAADQEAGLAAHATNANPQPN
ncbi:hypothetical protein DSO57_1004244 [Entomophthora muscae]|uniref:Uncharacterized protein n=1 Tax=Entomophthora muscae TaxID=34485 RepID=A0ACC2SAE4_9FUNG|nr:hypothetical protein DSO57_1004244 [Entomophthora muscae]